MNGFFRTVLLFLLVALFFIMPRPAGAITVAPPDSTTRVKNWQQSSTIEKAQAVCALAAVVAFFVSEVWFIVAGFKASVGWGLFMLFIGGMRSIGAAVALIAWLVWWAVMLHDKQPVQMPIIIATVFLVFIGGGAIVFMARHWAEARRPFFVMIFGILMLLVVGGLQIAK